MSTSTLAQLFRDSRRFILLDQLSRATRIEDVALAIHDELEGFSAVSGPYVNGLPKSEVTVALAILALVRDYNGQLLEAAPARAEKPSAETASVDQNDTTFKCGIVTLSASAGASAGLFFGPIGAIIGAALLGTGVTLYIRNTSEQEGGKAGSRANRPRKGRSSKGEHSQNLDATTMVSLDKEKICDGVLKLLQRIDTLVETFGAARSTPPPEQPAATLADFPEVLRLFQMAWSAVRSKSAEDLDAIVQRQFPSVLRGSGLEVMKVTEEELARAINDSNLNRLLDIDFSDQVQQLTLDFPPISLKGKVVARGRVLAPPQSEL